MPSVVPGPFDRVRPLDGAGHTVLAYFSGTGTAAVVKAIRSDEDRLAAGLWSSLKPHPSLVSAAGLLASGDGVVYDYVAPDAYSRKAQVRSAFERRLRRDPIAFPELLRLGVQACRGLEHAYASGVRGHGNLKPSNLLVGLDGGLRVSEPGMPGTESPVHMAPERFEGAPADERSDAYSLAVILYQMAAAGRPPFEAPTPGASGEDRFREELHRLHKDALVPRLDSPLAALLERGLAKAPGARPGMAALRAELEDLVRRETGLLPALPGPAEAAGWERAQQALALLATGRAEPALLAFDQAMSALPPSAALRAARATALHVAGRPEEAVASADEALAVDPQNPAAWQQKGVSLASLGRSDEAASALEQAAFLAPRDAAPRVALAVLLGRLGRLSQSLAAYDRAVDADPDHVDVWLERGKTLADAGLLADAAGALLRFLDLTPAHHPARPRAEELLREAREGVASAPAPQDNEPVGPREPSFEPEPEPAAEDSVPTVPEPSFIPDTPETDHPVLAGAPAPEAELEPPRAAVEPPPVAAPPEPDLDSRPEAEPQRGSEPRPARGPEPPVPEMEHAPEAEPEPGPTDAAGWSAHGISLFKAGRLDRALHAFDQAISAEGRSAAHWANRASVLFRLGRPEEALGGLTRALALDPRLASSWFNKAAIEKALGRPAEAARSLLELRALDPPPDDRLLEQAHNLQAEIEGQGVSPAPRGALGFLRAGLQAAEAGRLEEAVAAFGSALTEDPLLPGAWLLKGDALAHLGRDAEAAQAYEEGLAADPSDTRLLLGFARSRARLGDLDMAAAVLSRCLEISTGEAHQTAQRLLAAVEARRRPAAPLAEPPAPEPPPPVVLEPPADVEPAPLEVPTPLAESLPATAAASAHEPAPAHRPEPAPAPEHADEPFPPAPAIQTEPPAPVPAAPPPPLPTSTPAAVPALSAAPPPDAAPPAAAVPAVEPPLPVVPPPAPVPPPAAAPPPAAVPTPPDPAGRAATLLTQGKPADALEVVEQALAAGVDDARVWLARGDALRLLGRREEAAASFDQALKRAPRDPQAWIKKGEALDAAGVHGEAASCYDKALELHPRHIGAWNSKGVALTRVGRMDEALSCFTRALELDPRFALARFNRGAAEDVLGRAREAVASFEAFLTLATPNQRAQIQHAQKRLLVLKAPRT